jgi:3-hydroxybutyryl-CoA dehydrogenase
MNILVVGERQNLQECHEKFGEGNQYRHVADHDEAAMHLNNTDLVFDFIIDQAPHRLETYRNYTAGVFLNTSKVSLADLTRTSRQPPPGNFFGFAGLPTLLDREVLEVCVLTPKDSATIRGVCDQLQTAYLLVDDRVGLVTPRVICMIINEAYCTVHDGTATREHIDQAMKLGTNYPYGPFEWVERIGIQHVYEVLQALYQDTWDGRYKICPLLKKEYLQNINRRRMVG